MTYFFFSGQIAAVNRLGYSTVISNYQKECNLLICGASRETKVKFGIVENATGKCGSHVDVCFVNKM